MPAERAVPISLASGAVLEGLFLRAAEGEARGAVIAPPHPLFGGSMDSPVVSELSWACSRAGIASLRFNWRGVGASSGSASGDPSHAREDYAAALEQLAETVEGGLVACGYSFGAIAALHAATGEARVRSLVLVAPPAEMLDAAGLEAAAEILILTGERDAIAPPGRLESIAAARGNVRVSVLPDADHFFAVGLTELGRITAEWLGSR